MRNRRDFLKFLGIGAGAAASVAIAVVADRGGTPVAPPRTILDIERKPKTYEGPDSVPEGDFIKRAPDFIRGEVDFEIIPDVNRERGIEQMMDDVCNTSDYPIIPIQSFTITGTDASEEYKTWITVWHGMGNKYYDYAAGS